MANAGNADEHRLLRFGAPKVLFDKAARRRVQAGPLALMLEGYLDLYAVVAAYSSVSTVGHR